MNDQIVTRNTLAKLLERVVKTEAGCWEFTGGRMPHGYGRFTVGRIALAHRVSWTLHRGPIPAGMVVMHRCDNPPCVNPDHLQLGTMADNQADMSRKGRAATGDRNGARKYPDRVRRPNPVHLYGERNGQARLTDDMVREIRASGLSGRDIAAKYGISKAQVSRIVNRKRWTHV